MNGADNNQILTELTKKNKIMSSMALEDPSKSIPLSAVLLKNAKPSSNREKLNVVGKNVKWIDASDALTPYTTTAKVMVMIR